MAQRVTTKLKQLRVNAYKDIGGNDIDQKVEWSTPFGLSGVLLSVFRGEPLKWLKKQPDILLKFTNYAGDTELAEFIKKTDLPQLLAIVNQTQQDESSTNEQ